MSTAATAPFRDVAEARRVFRGLPDVLDAAHKADVHLTCRLPRSIYVADLPPLKGEMIGPDGRYSPEYLRRKALEERWPNASESACEARARLGIPGDEDRAAGEPLLTDTEVGVYTARALQEFAAAREYLPKFFRRFVETPKQGIDVALHTLSNYRDSVPDKVYTNAVYLLIPLMPHLTEEDCEKVVACFNNGSFYFDPMSGEKVGYEPFEGHDDLDSGYEGEHFLWTTFSKVFPHASDTFMQVYAKLYVDKGFWANDARLCMAEEMLDFRLVNLYAPRHRTLLIDLYTFATTQRHLSRSAVAHHISRLNGMGVLRKSFPFVKAAYTKNRVDYSSSGSLLGHFPLNGIKPADSDISFLIHESQNTWLLKLKDGYLEMLSILRKATQWTMLSDEVECGAMECSVVGKAHTSSASGESKLLRCGGCKLRYYCSPECQKRSWTEGHKHLCRFFQTLIR